MYKRDLGEREIVKHGLCQIWKREQKIGVSGFVHSSSSKYCQICTQQQQQHQALPKSLAISQYECGRKALIIKQLKADEMVG